ncbi:hypothetical protein TVAG_320440 [Trichomonas vaginalis G3]|uniref:Uncharacterized protein n=1 Tax=Trichomonas vaginalis (strain ATCC PRA-98 / G3) TaxID=412133 RepID=A2G0B3_TRIV3|nr:glycoprotein 38 family [Trichomonas vaginalis G3]EAX89410.1 hypothetical protein TVAG_320440 [Trichomonas vaginalis G3]KAI5494148.1 glycoprotein 38 family [Trichomonas vaginalis G3]|eukprot:XP_001302340.1 hypothetical protein [Trichomonas vaginalis G3]
MLTLFFFRISSYKLSREENSVPYSECTEIQKPETSDLFTIQNIEIPAGGCLKTDSNAILAGDTDYDVEYTIVQQGNDPIENDPVPNPIVLNNINPTSKTIHYKITCHNSESNCNIRIAQIKGSIQVKDDDNYVNYDYVSYITTNYDDKLEGHHISIDDNNFDKVYAYFLPKQELLLSFSADSSSTITSLTNDGVNYQNTVSQELTITEPYGLKIDGGEENINIGFSIRYSSKGTISDQNQINFIEMKGFIPFTDGQLYLSDLVSEQPSVESDNNDTDDTDIFGECEDLDSQAYDYNVIFTREIQPGNCVKSLSNLVIATNTSLLVDTKTYLFSEDKYIDKTGIENPFIINNENSYDKNLYSKIYCKNPDETCHIEYAFIKGTNTYQNGDGFQTMISYISTKTEGLLIGDMSSDESTGNYTEVTLHFFSKAKLFGNFSSTNKVLFTQKHHRSEENVTQKEVNFTSPSMFSLTPYINTISHFEFSYSMGKTASESNDSFFPIFEGIIPDKGGVLLLSDLKQIDLPNNSHVSHTPQPTEPGKFPVGIVAGVVCALVVAFTALAVTIWFVFFRKRNNKAKKNDSSTSSSSSDEKPEEP